MSAAGTTIDAVRIPSGSRRFTDVIAAEGPFVAMLVGAFLLTGATYQTPGVAMWVGFLFAAYAATSNDSIQTIGTFLASNAHRRWWVLWAYIGAIFVLTTTYSWVAYDGDVSYARLASKGFETAPTSFSYLQIAAPLFLLILTRLRVPVSTTFLCLSGFAASAEGIGAIVSKSVVGYVLAFGVAIVLWTAISGVTRRLFQSAPHPLWMPAQWLTSGALWSVWLMQDAANVAVYLPRQLSAGQFGVFVAVMLAGLALLFFMRGDRIQRVVTEKTGIVDIRAATIVDFVYALILWYFKVVSNVPMSTTWVFVGLLAGRELAITFTSKQLEGHRLNSLRAAGGMVGRDLGAVLFGLVVSLGIAASVNPVIREEFGATLARWWVWP